MTALESRPPIIIKEMPNKNYLKGVRYEREVVNNAKSEGHVAFRSAGSHSPFDVVIIDFSNRVIEFSQLKTGSSVLKKKEKEAFKEFIDGSFQVVFTQRTKNQL